MFSKEVTHLATKNERFRNKNFTKMPEDEINLKMEYLKVKLIENLQVFTDHFLGNWNSLFNLDNRREVLHSLQKR